MGSTARNAWIFGSVFVVLAVVIIVIVSTLGSSGKAPHTATDAVATKPAPSSISTALADVTSAQLAAAGLGGGQVAFLNSSSSPGSVFALHGVKPLTSGGKPLVVYYGSEYCPFCAATRWAFVVALDKFGTLSGLSTTASSPVDVAPNTHTLSFRNATYVSKYLTLSTTEVYDNKCTAASPNPNPPPNYVCSGTYGIIQRPSAFVQGLVNKYDTAKYVGTNNADGIPFIMMGNRWVQSGAPYVSQQTSPPFSLTGLSWQQIVDSFQAAGQQGSPGQAILGAANHYIAAFCGLISGSKPAICSSAPVRAAAATLK